MSRFRMCWFNMQLRPKKRKCIKSHAAKCWCFGCPLLGYGIKSRSWVLVIVVKSTTVKLFWYPATLQIHCFNLAFHLNFQATFCSGTLENFANWTQIKLIVSLSLNGVISQMWDKKKKKKNLISLNRSDQTVETLVCMKFIELCFSSHTMDPPPPTPPFSLCAL